MNLLEFGLYALLVVILGLMLVSFFLIWNWFDARERLHIVRADTREETIRGIHHGHNKCRVLLYISILLALCYAAMPFVIGDYMNTLPYPAIVIIADILMLVGLRRRSRDYIKSIDFSEAEKMPGVVKVLTAKDVPGTNPQSMSASTALETVPVRLGF